MGQEVVARTQYLGQAKQHLYYAELSSLSPPVPGDTVFTSEQVQAGTVVNIAPDLQGHYQLLLVFNDALAQDAIFQIGNKNISFENSIKRLGSV